MDDMEEAIREYYRSRTLSEEKMQNILALKSEPANRRSFRFAPRKVGIGLAAALVPILLFFGYRHNEFKQVRERALVEIAMNHRKSLDVEYRTDDFTRLQRDMTRLDFSLLAAESESHPAGYELIGARYCSIQGALAAQLKFRSGSGKIATVYVVRPVGLLDGVGHYEGAFERVKIRLWQAGGLLFGFARDED